MGSYSKDKSTPPPPDTPSLPEKKRKKPNARSGSSKGGKPLAACLLPLVCLNRLLFRLTSGWCFIEQHVQEASGFSP